MRILARRLLPKSAPDLPPRGWIVIHQTHPQSSLSSYASGCNASRTGSNDHHIECRTHPVTTRIPGEHSNWQLRWCGSPSTVTRHSMQIPMPHNGPRASPPTDNRHDAPAIVTAAATLVPGTTWTGLPLTVMEMPIPFNSPPRSPASRRSRGAEIQLARPNIAYNFVYYTGATQMASHFSATLATEQMAESGQRVPPPFPLSDLEAKAGMVVPSNFECCARLDEGLERWRMDRVV